MLKFISILLTVIYCFGGCQMNANSQTAENKNSVEKKILDHAKKNFSLSENEVTLKKMEATNLPNGVESFYLEEKKSYGNKFYNYLAKDEKLFSSGDDNDFGRFLQEINFLKEKNLSTEQFWTAFQKLRFPYRTAVLVDEQMLKTPYSALKPVVDKVTIPKLNVNENGADFTFYIVDTNLDEVRKYDVKVSEDYQVALDFTKVE